MIPSAFFAVLATFSHVVAGLGLACTALGTPSGSSAKKAPPPCPSLSVRFSSLRSIFFFPLVSVPVGLRGYLTWNPLLHALELIRDARFVGYNLATRNQLFRFSFGCAIISFCSGALHLSADADQNRHLRNHSLAMIEIRNLTKSVPGPEGGVTMSSETSP